MIDYKRLDSVKVRNVHESVDLHDIIKLMLVRVIRKQNKNKKYVQLYTEHNIPEPNQSYPDIQAVVTNKLKARYKKLGGTIMSARDYKSYIWEIQENCTKQWTDSIVKKYVEHDGLIIISLNDIKNKFKLKTGVELNTLIKALREIIEDKESNYSLGKLY